MIPFKFRFHSLSLLWRSSTDLGSYSKFKKRPIKSTVIYITIILGLFSFLLGLLVWLFGLLGYVQLLKNVGDDFPTIQLQKGVLAIDKTYSHKDDRSGLKIFADTSQVSKDYNEINDDYGLYVLQDGLILKQLETKQFFEYPISEKDLKLDNTNKKKFGIVLFASLFLIIPLAFFISHAISAAFYSLFFGLVLFTTFKISQYDWKFKEVLNITLMVNGPAIFYSTIIRLLGLSFPLLYMVIYSCFLLFVINNLRGSKKIIDSNIKSEGNK